MIHVVTDSCSDITPEEAARIGVTVVPLMIRFGSEEFKDGVEITADEFYSRLAKSKVNPTTSQPSPAEFSAVYEPLLAKPEDSVVSIHISQKQSGTVQSANLAAKPFGDRVRVVDSRVVTGPEALLVHAAKRAVDAGTSLDDVVTDVEARARRSNLLGLVDTMEYFVRGGRAGRAQGFIGGVLQIKPMVTITEGEVALAGKYRGSRNGVEGLLSRLAAEGEIEAARVMHSASPNVAATVLERVRQTYPKLDVDMGQLGPVVGTHTGPGVVGVGYIRRG